MAIMALSWLWWMCWSVIMLYRSIGMCHQGNIMGMWQRWWNKDCWWENKIGRFGIVCIWLGRFSLKTYYYFSIWEGKVYFADIAALFWLWMVWFNFIKFPRLHLAVFFIFFIFLNWTLIYTTYQFRHLVCRRSFL